MTYITKKCVCIFAHPDDEAFGPSGTIAKLASVADVYLICVTNGNDKTNGTKNLANIRDKELHQSSRVLGVKKVFCLSYEDGELSNNNYHDIAGKVEKILKKIKPDTLMTFEMRGVSGHIDHVFCSMVTSYLFTRLSFVKKLMYYATHKDISEKMSDYFIYFPPGYKESEVDEVVDISKYWHQKTQAIKAHASQKKDVDRVLKILKYLSKKELFFVLKK